MNIDGLIQSLGENFQLNVGAKLEGVKNDRKFGSIFIWFSTDIGRCKIGIC